MNQSRGVGLVKERGIHLSARSMSTAGRAEYSTLATFFLARLYAAAPLQNDFSPRVVMTWAFLERKFLINSFVFKALRRQAIYPQKQQLKELGMGYSQKAKITSL